MTDVAAKKILAIDCSGRELKLALKFGQDRTVKLSVEAGHSHGQLLIEKITDLTNSAELKIEELAALVVCTGPGSFTGLRIALAATKAMATSLEIPVAGINLFELAAAKLKKTENPVYVIVPFKRDAVFVGEVNSGEYDESSITVVPMNQLSNHFTGSEVALCGFDEKKLSDEIKSVVTCGKISFDAADLLQAGIEKLEHGEIADLVELEPLYVQKSQAEIKLEQAQRDRN